ncbi:hypothetical protein KFE25_004193 [Diacronema lutheri]|uniref:Exostosin GT47 domain-containing protein n=1 Tax=Diacronema lutheri TaxID=2081491 RepID=A0A8J6C2Y2_DIALT|nr:hypothetical protein KFE25_004193 [Diacronema lutheri]
MSDHDGEDGEDEPFLVRPPRVAAEEGAKGVGQLLFALRAHWRAYGCALLLAIGALTSLAAVAARRAPAALWLARARADLEARGLRCVNARDERGRTTDNAGRRIALHCAFAEEPSGPSARALLNASARAQLERAVAQRGARAPNGRCPIFSAKVAAQAAKKAERAAARGGRAPADSDLAADASVGEGGVLVLAPDAAGVSIRPAGKWGDGLSPRRACTFATCFSAARRRACVQAGPVRVLWYAPSDDWAADNARGGARAAGGRWRSVQAMAEADALAPVASAEPHAAIVSSAAQIACSFDQCAWLRAGLARPHGGWRTVRGGAATEPLAQLVTEPSDACLFVVTPEALYRRKARCKRTDLACAHPAASLRHWAAVDGRDGRNHVLLMPQCVGRCDWPAEPRVLGQTGDAIVASPATWRGLFRRGFDVQLPQPFMPPMAELAARAPVGGWWGVRAGARAAAERAADGTRSAVAAAWVSAVGSDATREQRPLLLTFRGTVGSAGGRWFDARLTAAAWSNEPSSAVLIAVADKPRSPKRLCGTEAHADWAVEPGASAAVRAAASGGYTSLLSSSSFGFAPGGGGGYSFRFLEVLAAGSVPVVPDDLVLPWEGATHRPLHWAACALRASRAELRALGELVRALAPPGSAAFGARRAACAAVWEELAGGGLEGAAVSGVARGHGAKERFDRAATERVWLELRARVRRALFAQRGRRLGSGRHARAAPGRR